MALNRQIKVLSAEARLSMKVMVALPPLLTLYIVKVNPEYMSLLWTRRIGVMMIIVAGVLMAFGVLLMRKLVKIDV
jgi:tight adherence protein B